MSSRASRRRFLPGTSVAISLNISFVGQVACDLTLLHAASGTPSQRFFQVFLEKILE
jgi:hypothetical protein